jgi:DNA-binding Xre family transcriptional regulator
MARFRARMTPSKLAAMIGTDEDEIESWEEGRSVIYVEELMLLCHALNVTPSDIVRRPYH